ncbi:SpoIIE family protein phosphatase [Jatrophihabitans endophyticus]|uniref:SpoIIE family protein phosphatase n=1 Tax=Jatrophihabitans endophyticus TaxID=1206085 RepID=UPI0019EDFE03|nr:SpoIIE family protein phosphatase [Jatrophihabitans endophyticus]MBE7188940.1 SpoIIE family protein phosphatase [Jatrophihabitans endophyticus]
MVTGGTGTTTAPLGGVDDEGALSAVMLPSAVHEASVAVLIVDLEARSVTYANDLAREFVPDRPLPVPVDEWSVLAGLEDVRGDELPEGSEPAAESGRPAESLLRIAGGEPVTGEAVTALRATSVTRAREVLWVVGLPMTGAPSPVERLALVVFLPARNATLVAGLQRSALSTRERAVLATRVSFTITDPSQPDNPLVWVNPAFTETTGYAFDEAVGHNCRFLQGDGTDRATVAEIAASIAAGRQVTTTLKNFRKDGSPFWNELSISPVRDESGTVTHFVGVQADVTSRVEAQATRDAALSQVAKSADRLALLADVTTRMATGRTPDQIIRMLANVLVPQIGSLGVVLLLDANGRPGRPYLVHEAADGATSALLERLERAIVAGTVEDGPLRQVLRGDVRHMVLSDYPQASDAASGAVSLLGDELGLRSMLAAPLRARHGVLGVVVVLTDESRPALNEGDLALTRDVAMRSGLMLENVQLYARERATAATLQRSLLPRLPEIDELEIAASYVPAADEAAVGGDWYDVFPLRRQHADDPCAVGVAVGDVMGHNYDSAARMGKLSTIVRAYGWPGSEPFTVLTAVDELLAGSDLDYMATCLYATLTLHEAGATLRYSSAGHPPAIVRSPDGSAVTLEHGRGPMIGISHMLADDAERPADATVELPHGSTLICFTDGLTDGFADEPDLEAGLTELIRLTGRLPVDAPPDAIVEALTGAALRHDDDVAVVAIRIR